MVGVRDRFYFCSLFPKMVVQNFSFFTIYIWNAPPIASAVLVVWLKATLHNRRSRVRISARSNFFMCSECVGDFVFLNSSQAGAEKNCDIFVLVGVLLALPTCKCWRSLCHHPWNSVCLFVCDQLYSKTAQAVCIKFAVWLLYDIIRSEWLTFGGDQIKNLDSAMGFWIWA